MRKITISDLTLKFLESQEKELSFRDRLLIAQKLDLANVSAIELSLAKNCKESEVVCRTICSSVNNAVVKIDVGVNKECVKTAVSCFSNAQKGCLQVVAPISTAQMEYLYHLKAPAMIELIKEMVAVAKAECEVVEFVAKDAFRAESGFLKECAVQAYNAGAQTITISDDAGVAFPEDYEKVVKEIKDACSIKVLVCPKDVLGLSSACALSAIKAGADGVVCSVYGDYLRLNVVSDLIRAKKEELKVISDLDTTKSKTLAIEIENTVQKGESESSDKQIAGVIESTATIHQVAERIGQLGYELNDSDVGKVFEEFKKLTAKKDVIENKELEAIIASTAMQVPSTYHLINFVVNSGNIIPATANVTLEKNGEKFTGVSTGDGPIDASFHAIEQIIGHHYELDDFQVQAVTKGRSAVGSSLIRLRANGKVYSGNGVSTDIIGACIRAYVNALNKIVYEGD